MNALAALPAWGALLVAILVASSALLALVGSIGLLRLKDFYSRLHAPTLGTTLGLFLMVVATIVCFVLAVDRVPVQVILIGALVSVTTPVTLTLLARAAVERDRRDGSDVSPRRSSSDP